MFYLDIWEGMIGGTYMSLWPVFNVADSAISIGIVAILLFQKKFIAEHEKPNLENTPAT
jgi:signal peptidase II